MALRGFANTGSPRSACSALSFSNACAERMTSPRISSRGGIARPLPGRAQAERHAADGPQVRGDVLAGRAVAARRARDERAVLVDQLDRDAVELGLGDVVDRARVAEEAADARLELLDLVAVHGVVERQHRARCGAPCRSARSARADPLRRRVAVGELGMRGFELARGAGTARRTRRRRSRGVEHVVEVVVSLDLVAELRDLGFGALRSARHGRTIDREAQKRRPLKGERILFPLQWPRATPESRRLRCSRRAEHQWGP